MMCVRECECVSVTAELDYYVTVDKKTKICDASVYS